MQPSSCIYTTGYCGYLFLFCCVHWMVLVARVGRFDLAGEIQKAPTVLDTPSIEGAGLLYSVDNTYVVGIYDVLVTGHK